MPANGISALASLPPFGGTVTGRVLEHDGTTASPVLTEGGFIPTNYVRLKSSVIYYGRTYDTRPPTAAGVFTFASALTDTTASVAVPLAPFTLKATHPWSQVVSPVVERGVRCWRGAQRTRHRRSRTPASSRAPCGGIPAWP